MVSVNCEAELRWDARGVKLEHFSGTRAVAKQAGIPLDMILLVEDDGARSKRRLSPGFRRSVADLAILVRLHKITDGKWERVVGETHMYRAPKRVAAKEGRPEAALKLLNNVYEPNDGSIVVAGTSYGNSSVFIKALVELGIDFAVEIRPSTKVDSVDGTDGGPGRARVSDLLVDAHWTDIEIILPDGKSSVRYAIADLGEIGLPYSTTGRIFAAQTGGIKGIHPGTIIGMTSLYELPLKELLRCLGWARWIRPFVRRQERNSQKPPSPTNTNAGVKSNCSLTLRHRSNIALARLQDESGENSEPGCFGGGARGVQFGEVEVLNLVELFAGAGGMGLGFLMAEHPKRFFRLVFSGELHPIYVQTLKNNHEYLTRSLRAKRTDLVTDSFLALNLNGRNTSDLVASKVRESGGVDVLIGGPPCQGFSSANRNSWFRSNPQNRMVNVFMRYVEKLKPRVFLMENVQGIVWTAKDGRADAQPSVVDHVIKRMESAGYLVFPKLMDAVWYGVPQFRTRFFLLGIHRGAGYRAEDFGTWGPFPAPTHGPVAGRPFTTVRDAIADLPAIENGHSIDEMCYCESAPGPANWFLRLMRDQAPKEKILDHITSRHADYVIERYERIPPGGNWQNIAEMMSNYAQMERTHSNIYRRLQWDDPSITIGHYRKSMLIHPEQHRGLSLREACRLQSFPDWFRFAGTEDGRPGGLMHKQQQLANAVCPLLSKKIAEFILEL